MRVLQIVHGWFPRHAGGTERYVAALSRELVAEGLEVEILAGSDLDRDRAGIAAERWEGLPLHRLHRRGLYLESWYHAWDPAASGLVEDLLRERRPDLVHVHHWKRLSRNLVEIATSLGIPAVVTLHDTGACCPRTFRVRRGEFCERFVSPENCGDCVERFWFQDDEEVGLAIEAHRDDFQQELALAAEVLAPSEALRRVVGRQFPELLDRIRVLEHGTIAAPPARSRRRRPDAREGKLRIASWGGLSPAKGTHLLVEAVARMKRADAVELEIWGGFDPGAKTFETRVRERAAGLPITFRGGFEAGELPLGRYDFAVFPSVACESHSFTVDEAWTAGLPTVVPDRGGPADRLGGGGFTFRAGREGDLARCLDELVDHPDRLEDARAKVPRPKEMAIHAAELIERYARAVRRGADPNAIDPARAGARARVLARRLDRRDQRLWDLRGESDARRRRVDELDGAIARRDEALAAKEKVLADFQAQLANLTRIIEEKEQEIAAAHRTLAEDRAAAEARRVEIEARLGRRDATIAELQGIRRGAEEELGRLRARDEDRERRLVLAEKQREELEAALADRQAALDEFSRSAAELAAARDAAEIELSESRRTAEAALADAKRESEAALAERATRLRDLEEELVRLRSEARSLEERLERAERRSRELENLRRDLGERNRRLEQLAENLGHQRARETSSLGVHQVALERALSDLDEVRAERAAVAERLGEIEGQLRERFAPIAAEVGLDAARRDDPFALVEAAIANHDRLHAIIAERGALLERLASDRARELAAEAKARAGAVRPAGLGLGSRVARMTRRLRRRDPERMRILTVVHDFLPGHAAGTEIYTYKLLKELRERHDVHLLFCEARHDQARYSVSRGEYDGLPYTEVVHNYQWTDFEETYRDPRMDAIFERVLDEFEPDLVHVQHLHYFSMNFVPLAKSRGLPVVYTLHEYMLMCARGGQLIREDLEICEKPVPEKCADCVRHWSLGDDYGLPDRRRELELVRASLPEDERAAWDRFTGPLASRPLDAEARRLYAAAVRARLDFIRDRIRGVDLFISPSDFLRRKFIEVGMVDPARIIHSDNGFDLTPFAGVTHRPSEVLRFGFVGTIAEYKGVHLMLEAMRGIEEPDVVLDVWGDLDTFHGYKERLLAIPRSERVRLRGRFDNARIAEVLAEIDVLIVPSLWFENSPLTIHEAWMAGIPVIASDRGGMAELVDDGVNGFHFRLGDADDLRAKMRAFIDDRGLAARLAAKVGEVKPIADNAREIEGYYRRLLAGEWVTA